MTRYYYAIYRPYSTGQVVHRFPSRRERDGWAWNDPGRCEAVKASHPLVRKAKRQIAAAWPSGWPWPING